MNAVRRVEEARGCRVVDVSAQKCGWDLTSYPPAVEGKQPDARHIEVKGRLKGAGTITVTRNEMLYALNQADRFILAIVLVGENDVADGPHYLRNPFDAEPGWGVSSVNYELKALLERTVADRTGHMSSQMINRYKRWARGHQEQDLGDWVPLCDAIPELSEGAKRSGTSDGTNVHADDVAGDATTSNGAARVDHSGGP
jgi:hypothetical protein